MKGARPAENQRKNESRVPKVGVNLVGMAREGQKPEWLNKEQEERWHGITVPCPEPTVHSYLHTPPYVVPDLMNVECPKNKTLLSY